MLKQENSLYTLILAPNPSLMTGAGTNTIVLGGGIEGATVIDPAVAQIDYLTAIIQAGADRGGIRRILLTHGHPDHMGGAQALSEMLGMHIYAASRKGATCADCELTDGMLIPAGDDHLRVLTTPGHRFDHLCFLLEESRVLFAGDLLAGSGTVVIIPPEGDMNDYLASLRRLRSMPSLREVVPAHGPVITDPQIRINEYITHRLERERQIIGVLEGQQASVDDWFAVPDIVASLYEDVDPQLHTMAGYSVLAHLLKLEREGRARKNTQGAWQLCL